MNILLKILPIILCMCFLVGCQVADAQTGDGSSCGMTPDPSENLIKAGEEVYYVINSLSRTGCEIHIVSMSCSRLTFVKPYYMEKKVGEEFERLEWKEEPVFVEIAMLIDSDNPADEKYSWDKYLGKLDDGTYRIVTDFYCNGEKRTAYFEFEMNNKALEKYLFKK